MTDKKKDKAQEEAQPSIEEETLPTVDPDSVEGLQQLLAEEKEKAEEYLANWQRAQADFANFKKRNEQERNEFAKFANSVLVMSVLPVIDDYERALESIPTEAAGLAWVEGIELIYRKLMTALEGQGLSIIETQGQNFDPNFHQAVLHEEGAEGKILEEFQKGYMLGGRLLRPAMVKVGNGEGNQADHTADQTD
ncbi:MAG: nucleotide exchange factor GrpE [Chloroflexota bacterium]|nr:nucleotide exchange factor GrpE [Chloroflexota bacterium]